jgi:hypothetical protein
MRKSRPIIAADQVSDVFDDMRVRELAEIARLPEDANMAAFAAGIREAALIYARDARSPNVNELHDEIERLYKAADRRRYEEVAVLLEHISPLGHDLLTEQGPSGALELPSSEALHDPAQRESACDTLARLCRYGERKGKGPPSKGSREKLCPQLYAPDKTRNPPKRDAERSFLQMLQLAWFDATGEKPTAAARHPDESRELGPFASFAKECLRLIGARGADVVELMNTLNKGRQ